MKPFVSKEELADLLTPLEPEPGTTAATECTKQQLIIEVGRVQVSQRKFDEIQQGTIILLDKKPDDLLDVYSNNQLIARGKAITIGNKIGIKLTEIAARRSSKSNT